jgi:hypothetical protein
MSQLALRTGHGNFGKSCRFIPMVRGGLFAKKWSKTLLDFDYVVLANATMSFANEFYSLFKDESVEEGFVYKVVKLGDSIRLEKIPYFNNAR